MFTILRYHILIWYTLLISSATSTTEYSSASTTSTSAPITADTTTALSTLEAACLALTNSNDTNGNISTNNVTDGTNVTLTCDDGYTLFGDAETTCFSGEWKPPLGTCKQDCQSLTNISAINGNISTNNVTDGTNVTLKCDDGYTLFGDAETTCFSGEWKPPLGTCKQDCQSLTNISAINGNISTNNVTDGTNVTLKCDDGYTLFGDAETTCFSGEWKPPLGTCKQDCQSLTNISAINGNISTNNVTDGTNVTLKCDDGYTLFGDAETTCFSEEWKPPLGTCKQDCQSLTNISAINGNISTNNVTDGTNVTLKCDDGYTLFGDAETTCFSGEWKPPLGTCKQVPSMVRSVTMDPVSSTALNISWAPGEGGYEYFIIKYNCSSPDEPVLNVIDDNTTELFVVKSGLLAGTKCNVSVTVHAGIQNSGPYWTIGSNATFETAPSMVANLRVDTVLNEPNRLSASWDEPETKNGIIRAYVVIVYKEKESIAMAMYNFTCTDCTEASIQHCEFWNVSGTPLSGSTNIYQRTFATTQSTFNCTIDNLLPYTQYTVIVTAVTACEGPAISIENKTDEDVPSAPGDPILFEHSQTSMTFGWEDPDPPNGEILEYMIIYEYYERACRGYGIKRTENETIPLLNKYNNSEIHNKSHTLHSLYSFWNYNITIIASTSKGYGNRSVSETFTTDESEPGVIDNITETHDSRNISLKWLPPCVPNGSIAHYHVSWINKDDPSDKGNTLSDAEEWMFADKLPYHNYSFQIAAINRRYQGPYTDEFDVQTDIEKPPPPNLIGVTALSSTVIQVEWEKMKDDQYTGPTIFTAKAYDSLNKSSVYQCLAEGFNATHCFIDKLDQFWNYTVKVIAKTEALNNSLQTTSNNSLEITTKEDSPGPVQNIVTLPESNVTKKRSIKVSWDRPIQRDLNGILTEYFITYQFYDSGSVVTERVKSDARSIILTEDIKPGNYNITVFAANAAGNGTIKSAPYLTVVSPGAPIRPEESANIQIVQKAAVEDIDSKTELAVSLNRHYFLCDTTNGNPTMWGVIVAQASEANGRPFFGSRDDYGKVLSKYKSWFDVKDSNSIMPYRATENDWNPSCANFETRSKQSVNSSTPQEQTQLVFVVGKDKDCEGKPSRFCNGQLPCGRSFRVKSFACTDGGCTETEYSVPIQTGSTTTECKTSGSPFVSTRADGLLVAVPVLGVLLLAALCVIGVLWYKRNRKTLSVSRKRGKEASSTFLNNNKTNRIMVKNNFLEMGTLQNEKLSSVESATEYATIHEINTSTAAKELAAEDQYTVDEQIEYENLKLCIDKTDHDSSNSDMNVGASEKPQSQADAIGFTNTSLVNGVETHDRKNKTVGINDGEYSSLIEAINESEVSHVYDKINLQEIQHSSK